MNHMACFKVVLSYYVINRIYINDIYYTHIIWVIIIEYGGQEIECGPDVYIGNYSLVVFSCTTD